MWYDDEDSGSNVHESAAGGEEIPLKKGLWTEEEDKILAEYVAKNGEGNWSAVGQILGRNGQSCRLRWMKHLRPDLKKGAFTKEDELKIVRLHAVMGNKWSKIAEQMPGRTDNEIKNYWNMRIRRCESAGLPLYSAEITINMANRASQSHDFEAGESSSMSDQGLDSAPGLKKLPLIPELQKLPLSPQYYQFHHNLLMKYNNAPSSSGNASLSAGGVNNFELPSLQSTTGNFNDIGTSEGRMFQQGFHSSSQFPLLFPDSDIFYNRSIDQNACSGGNAAIPTSLSSPLPSFDGLFRPLIQSPPTHHQAQLGAAPSPSSSSYLMGGKGKLCEEEAAAISHHSSVNGDYVSQSHNFDVAAATTESSSFEFPILNPLPRLPDIDHMWGTAPTTQIRQDQLHDVNLYNDSYHAPSFDDDHDILDAWIQSQLLEAANSSYSSPLNDGYLGLDPPQINLEASNLAKEENVADTSNVNYDDDVDFQS